MYSPRDCSASARSAGPGGTAAPAGLARTVRDDVENRAAVDNGAIISSGRSRLESTELDRQDQSMVENNAPVARIVCAASAAPCSSDTARSGRQFDRRQSFAPPSRARLRTSSPSRARRRTCRAPSAAGRSCREMRATAFCISGKSARPRCRYRACITIGIVGRSDREHLARRARFLNHEVVRADVHQRAILRVDDRRQRDAAGAGLLSIRRTGHSDDRCRHRGEGDHQTDHDAIINAKALPSAERSLASCQSSCSLISWIDQMSR